MVLAACPALCSALMDRWKVKSTCVLLPLVSHQCSSIHCGSSCMFTTQCKQRWGACKPLMTFKREYNESFFLTTINVSFSVVPAKVDDWYFANCKWLTQECKNADMLNDHNLEACEQDLEQHSSARLTVLPLALRNEYLK